MLPLLSGLFPVFSIIALGWIIRRADFPGEGLWPPLERIIYFILFPCLLVQTLASADLEGIDILPMGGALLFALVLMTALLSALRPRLHLSGPVYSSLFQGAVRWNGFIGIAVASNLFGTAGMTLMAIAISFLVPAANIFSIYVLNRHAGNGDTSMAGAAIAMLRNPLILACITGIGLNAGGIDLPLFLDTTLEVLGNASLPLGLLAVGAALDLPHARQFSRIISLGAGLKMVGMPLLVAATTWLFGVEGVSRGVAILCGAVPSATSAYILARQLGGDAAMMAGLITVTTLVSLITMPLVILLLI